MTDAESPPIVVTWRTVAASAVGARHARSGDGCQDAWASARLPDERGVVVAVADGAGSAAHAERGAQIAVAAAVASVFEDFSTSTEENSSKNAIGAARIALVATTAGNATALSELACTLAVAVVTVEGVQAAVVGDACVVVRDGDGGLLVVTGEPGEYLNETTFITSSGWERALRSARFDGRHDVALFSDGLELLARDAATGAAHTPFFAPLFDFAANAGDDAEIALGTFLASDRIRGRTDDDVTLALVVRDTTCG